MDKGGINESVLNTTVNSHRGILYGHARNNCIKWESYKFLDFKPWLESMVELKNYNNFSYLYFSSSSENVTKQHK